MRRHLSFIALAAAGAVVLTGCPQCAPDLVAGGVAPLTVRNVGAMVSLANADDACGFASQAVLDGAVADGAIGSEGTITTTVEGCVIDLGPSPVDVSDDCSGNKTTASGKLTISATRTVAGVLTGDDVNPIVPGGPDAVTITITSAAFESFEVFSSSSDASLRMISGSLSATVKPRLAVAADSGACAIATPNVSFNGITYAPSQLHVTSADNNFDVDVATSNFGAQNGKGPGGAETENTIAGNITVFGSDQVVAGALDPEYDAAKFVEAYACTPNLRGAEDFVCDDLEPRLADGAARLTVKMLGTIAGLIDADDACGFASAASQGTAVVAGAPGGTGSLTTTVTDCVITFPEETTLEADCTGAATTVQGGITVSGTKTVSGRVTGNPESPIVPITDQPAAISLSVVVNGFKVGSTEDENALRAQSGTLEGTVTPKVFVGISTGVCSVSSPNAGFDEVTWDTAELLVSSASGTFGISVDDAELEAANGTSASGANELAGVVTIDGAAHDVPSDGNGLNPEFAQADVDASFTCDPDLVLPLNDQCAGVLLGTVAGGAAALTMRTFGTVVSLIDADTACGFSSLAVGGTPTFTVDSAVGDPDVTATFSLGAGCQIQLPAEGIQVGTPDCNGTTTTVGGTVVVTGTKAVSGFRTGDPAEPIVPTQTRPATFTLSMTFTEFFVSSSASTATLTVHGGSLAGTLQPRLALDAATTACSLATPNVTFGDITWSGNATATLTSDGNSFDVALDDSDLDAQAGTTGDPATENTLNGVITADGNAITFPVDSPLDPDYEADGGAAFLAGYVCGLPGEAAALVDDATCNGAFRTRLGNGVARLLVKAAATAVSVHDGNAACGFADATPDTAPVQTGAAGTIGNFLQTADANCAVALPSDTPLGPPDCAGTQGTAGGSFVVAAATKSIDGFLTGANPPIFPVSRDAVTFTATDVAFTDWNVYDELVDGSVDAEITVRTGTASVVVEPVTGRSTSNSDAASAATGGAVQNVFTVKTPVVAISNLTMAAGTVTLVSEGKTFNLGVTGVDLDAFAGTFFDGIAVVGSNDISGAITVDGVPVALAPDLLIPYDQAALDASYTCNPDIGTDVVPSAAP